MTQGSQDALQSADGCDLQTVSTGRTGSDGTATLTMTVRRIILVQGVEVDCAVAGACILGAATIPDGFNPTESASSSIQFDPNVPPIPRLTVELTVDTITRYVVSGTVTCNRDAELYANAFVQQTARATRRSSRPVSARKAPRAARRRHHGR